MGNVWPLPPREYRVSLFIDDGYERFIDDGYESLASATLMVEA